jgi:hypothetical protein
MSGKATYQALGQHGNVSDIQFEEVYKFAQTDFASR